MKRLIFLYCVLIVYYVKSSEYNYCPPKLTKQIYPPESNNDTLELVSVIFRHGNRTTTGLSELYPNDPYLNYSYFPTGHGQLTNAGKVKAFLIGTSLRKKYDTFLGRFYYPEIVEAITTSRDRTKMTLQLALAGLFPPTRADAAATGLPWQAVPFSYVPIEKDRVLGGTYCPQYHDLYQNYTSLPKIQTKIEKYQEVFDYVLEHAGINVTMEKLYHLYLGLSAESDFGFTLPLWTKTIFPDTLEKIAEEEYYISMGLLNMKRMAVGYFFEKLLKDIDTKIEDTRKNKLSRKIHLHAGHEITIAQLLIALKVYEKHVPTYGSYIIFELHKINGVYGIKVLHQNWDKRGLRLLKLPQCEEFCPLEEFKLIVKNYLPTRGLCE